MEGTYLHNIDAKGRLAVPARLRDELGESFHVTISVSLAREISLAAYSKEGWIEFTQKVNAMPALEKKKMDPFFTNAIACTVDSQGRILLPQNLRALAKLQKDVAVVGVGDHAEFWDAEKWAEKNAAETDPEYLLRALEALG
jgi:MraZ protein